MRPHVADRAETSRPRPRAWRSGPATGRSPARPGRPADGPGSCPTPPTRLCRAACATRRSTRSTTPHGAAGCPARRGPAGRTRPGPGPCTLPSTSCASPIREPADRGPPPPAHPRQPTLGDGRRFGGPRQGGPFRPLNRAWSGCGSWSCACAACRPGPGKPSGRVRRDDAASMLPVCCRLRFVQRLDRTPGAGQA